MDAPVSLYAIPRPITDAADCWFYHTIDLPGVGTVEGEWDLRGGVDAYLGHQNWNGKRVLELGTASGYLCFAMEERGANVVAFDQAPGLEPDLIPLATEQNLGEKARGMNVLTERLRNSYWFCHRLRKSKAQVVYGNIYDLPPAIGPVDVATFGCILLHLRDPFLALANAARFVKEAIVVTEVFYQNEWDARILGAEYLPAPTEPPLAPPTTFVGHVRRKLRPIKRALLGSPPVPSPPVTSVPAVVFMPNPADPTLPTKLYSWWQFSPAALQRMLGVLGFADSTVTTHTQIFQKTNRVQLFTVVARRTAPAPSRIAGPYPWY
jgi:SAM-dependent methyltransferase